MRKPILITILALACLLFAVNAAERNPLQDYVSDTSTWHAIVGLKGEGPPVLTPEKYRQRLRYEGVIGNVGSAVRYGIIVGIHPTKVRAGQSIPYTGAYIATLEDLKPQVHVRLRDTLSNPAVLHSLSALVRPGTIKELKRQPGSVEIAAVVVEEFIRLLDGSQDNELKAKLAAMEKGWAPYREKEATCVSLDDEWRACREISDTRQRLLEQHHLSDGMFRDYEWVQRQLARPNGRESIDAFLVEAKIWRAELAKAAAPAARSRT